MENALSLAIQVGPTSSAELQAFNRNSERCLDGRITGTGKHPAACGGHADIWKGQLAHRGVAVKVIRPWSSVGKQLQQKKLLKRLWREYSAWSSLSHPNVLDLLGFSYDFCPEWVAFPALVSPWMSNGTVDSYIECYKLANRLNLLLGIAEGLSYLHTREPAIVHGDLRAGNVLVSDFGIPCLSDFGLSRILSDTKQTPTSSEPAGSLRWMSPELFRDEGGVSVQSDIWAFGMTVLEVLTGNRPYSTSKSDAYVLGRITDGTIPSRPEDTTIRNIFNDELWLICRLCWSFKPTQRPSMREILSVLRGDYSRQVPLDIEIPIVPHVTAAEIQTPQDVEELSILENIPTLEHPARSLRQCHALLERMKFYKIQCKEIYMRCVRQLFNLEFLVTNKYSRLAGEGIESAIGNILSIANTLSIWSSLDTHQSRQLEELGKMSEALSQQAVSLNIFSLMARSSTIDGSLDEPRKDGLQSESAETRKYDNKHWGSPIDVIEWDSIGSLLAPPLLSGMGIPSPSQENTETIFDELEPGLAYPPIERYLRQASSSTSVPSEEPLSPPNSYESINWQFQLHEDLRPTTSSTTTDPTNALYTSLAAQRNGFFEPHSSHERPFSAHPPGPEPPSSLRPKTQYFPEPHSPMWDFDLESVRTMPHQNLQHDVPRHNPDPQPRGEVSAFDSLVRSNSFGLDLELTSLGKRESDSETVMSDRRPVKRARADAQQHGTVHVIEGNGSASPEGSADGPQRTNASVLTVGQGSPSIIPGACRSCKMLNFRCEFAPGRDVCHRCEADGHPCLVDGPRLQRNFMPCVPKARRSSSVHSKKRSLREFSPADLEDPTSSSRWMADIERNHRNRSKRPPSPKRPHELQVYSPTIPQRATGRQSLLHDNHLLSEYFSTDDEYRLNGVVVAYNHHPLELGGCTDIREGFLGGRKVAIKTIRHFRNARTNERGILQRLRCQFTRSVSALHPNVLSYLGFSYDFTPQLSGFPALILPWMSNGTLSSYLASHTGANTYDLALGVARGVAYMHAQEPPIVHGDIRTENILISDSGVPCLSGVCVTDILNLEGVHMSAHNTVSSLRWMSPELLCEDTAPTASSDVWAYGMTVLEMISRNVPYQEVKSSAAVFSHIREGKMPLRPTSPIPDDMWTVCLQCWTTDTARRPPMRAVQIRLLDVDQRAMSDLARVDGGSAT